MSRACKVPDCDRQHFCKGYCRLHFERWKRHGSPDVVLKSLSPRGEPMRWLREHAKFSGDECLKWPFARFPDGRAHMNGAKPTRVMCELVHGPAPDRAEAAHSCGKGHEACVNPRHLRWATSIENAADKSQHGTAIVGEAHYAAKLTEADVCAIRQLRGRQTLAQVGAMYGVGASCISKVQKRTAWRHVR